MLWAHGAAPDLLNSIHASKRNRLIIAGSEDLPYWICTLPPVSVAWSDWAGHGNACSCLVRHDSELLIGGASIYSPNVVTRAMTYIAGMGSNGIDFISATSDGNMLAVGTEKDWLTHLYDRRQGRVVATWPNGDGPSAFSADGKLLVTYFHDSDQEHGLAIIDVASHSVLHRYSMRVDPAEPYEIASAIKFSPVEPDVFAVVDEDYLIVMDTSGKIRAHWPMGTSLGNDVLDYSPDGSTIAVATDGNIVLLHPSDGNYSTLPGGAQYVSFLDNDTLAATDGENVYLFSASQQKYLGQLTETPMTVWSLAYSKDGSELYDGINLWDAANGNLLASNPRGPGSVWHFVCSDDLSHSVAQDGNTELRLYTSFMDTGRIIPVSIGPTTDTSYAPGPLVMSPNDSTFVSGGDITSGSTGNDTLDSRNAIKLWNAYDGSFIRAFDAPFYPASSVVFSHDGSRLAGIVDDTIYLWDVTTGHQIKMLGMNIPIPEYFAHNISNIIGFFPGDSLLLLGCYDSAIAIDRIRDDSIWFIQTDLSENYGTTFLLPDGKHFVEIPYGQHNAYLGFNISYYNDSSVNVVDVNTGKSTLLTANGEELRAFALNPVTGDIATGTFNGSDGSLVVWNSPFGTDGVNSLEAQNYHSLQAFAANDRLSVQVPKSDEPGRVFVYNILGVCCFSQEAQPGESSVTTGALPAGNYFIVFKSAHGAPEFAKVSLLQ